MKAKNLGRTLLLTLLMAILSTGMALASEGTEIEVTGLLVGIFPDENRLEIEVDNEGILEILSVQVGGNFDFESLVLGDLIEAKGTLNEDGVLVLTELKIRERARDRIKTRDGELMSYYCSTEGKLHPVAQKIAETYGVAYEDILAYLCSETPVPLGQIMLALQTASLSGGDYTTYLDGFEGISWGLIWQDLGLQGKPDHGTPPGQIKKDAGDGESEGKVPPGQEKKNGEEQVLSEQIFDWLPLNWFQKGKK